MELEIKCNVNYPQSGYMIKDDFTKEEWEWLCDECQVPRDTELIELHFTDT